MQLSQYWSRSIFRCYCWLPAMHSQRISSFNDTTPYSCTLGPITLLHVCVVFLVTSWSVPVIRMQSGLHSGSLAMWRKPKTHTHTVYYLSRQHFSLPHTGFCLPSRQLVIELWLGEQSWIGADKEDMTHNRSDWMELLNQDKGEETP